jgi:hypothetical protein
VPTTTAPNYRVIRDDKERLNPAHAPRPRTSENMWLKWLVRFAQLDAREVAARDWGSTLIGFALFASKWATADFEAEIDDPVALAATLHSGFVNFVNHGEWETPALHSLKIHVRFGSTPEVAPMGSIADVVIFGAAQLLLKHGRRIKSCAADGCARVFLARGRQIHCSSKCRSREQQRLFIESKGGPEGFAKYRSEMRIARLHEWKGPNRRTKNKGAKQ